MIIKIITKMTVTDDQGNVIKEKEYGKAYLSEIDFLSAAKDRWRVIFHNSLSNKKKRQSKESKELCKIVDTLIAQTKRTILGKFLCDSGEVWREYKKEREKKNEL